MNDSIKFNLEKGLYALAIILALAIRLAGLGSLPLSDPEATLAMQSLDLARGTGSAVQAEPAYVLLTGGLFFFTQATEFAARFWPAIFGAMLPVVAYLLRKNIGIRPALILAFGLALDPGLVALSRQANGAAMALSFVLLAGALALNGKSLLAGVFAGLALLGGVSLWPGLIGISLVFLFFRQVMKLAKDGDGLQLDWRQAGYGGLAALLVVGTLVMTEISGLGGIGNSLGAYFSGWGGGGGGVSIVQMFLLLPVYHLLPFVFGFIGIVRSLFIAEDHLGHGLVVWFGLALLIGVIYPARQVTDLAWALIPLWGLAARELARIRLTWDEFGRVEIGHAALVILMVVFLSWSFVRLPNPTVLAADTNQINSFVSLMAGFALLVLIFGLVAWGWSFSIAGKGLRLGMVAALTFFMISATWNAAGFSGAPETEMWRTGALPKEAALMKTTLDDLSSWYHHTPDKLDVAVVGVDSESLHWLLRDYKDVRYLSVIAVEDNPSVVITPSQNLLEQSSPYRGQDFVWSSVPAWSLLSPYDFIHWIIFRDVMMENQSIIVWVRSDIFPGAGSNSNNP